MVIALLLLAACAATIVSAPTGEKLIRWIQESDLSRDCGKTLIGTVAGCYRIRGDTCYIYTLPMRSETDRERMETLGHEVRHCFDGNFHSSMSY